MSDGKKAWAEEMAENDDAERFNRFKQCNTVRVWKDIRAAKDSMKRLIDSKMSLTRDQHVHIDAIYERLKSALGERGR